jgi:hypothetical protein
LGGGHGASPAYHTRASMRAMQPPMTDNTHISDCPSADLGPSGIHAMRQAIYMPYRKLYV